jgi:YfiH family protein
MTWTLDAASPPLWLPAAPAPGCALAFSTRRGGVSRAPFDTLNLGRSTEDDPVAVDENRRRLLDRLGLTASSLALGGQVHGATVTRVAAPGFAPATDGLLTRTPGVTLAVGTADCVPLLMTAPGAVAAVHSGWRGTVAGIPAAAAVALAAAAESELGDLVVHLGPSIRACCYRVGHDVARQFPSAAVRSDGDGIRLDLVAAIRLALGEAGVPGERVQVIDACTACDPSRYFSHRRDGPRTGRHWAVAALRA